MTKLKTMHGACIPTPKRGHAPTREEPAHGDGKQTAEQKAGQRAERKAEKKRKAKRKAERKAEQKRKAKLARAQRIKQLGEKLRRANSLHKDDETISTMLGGMKSSSIKSRGSYTHTPVDDEKPEEQRHAIWQPPQTDKSRFSGVSSSRHKATASYKVGADYETIAHDDKKQAAGKSRKKKQNKKRRKAKGKTKGQGGSATQSSPKTAPLSAKEIKTFDSSFRIYGGDPSWKGWDNKAIPGRTRRFLFSQVHALGLDKPDDKNWTKGEKKVFKRHRGTLSANSPKWKTLLPRKSEQAIRKAYADRLARHRKTL